MLKRDSFLEIVINRFCNIYVATTYYYVIFFYEYECGSQTNVPLTAGVPTLFHHMTLCRFRQDHGAS